MKRKCLWVACWLDSWNCFLRQVATLHLHQESAPIEKPAKKTKKLRSIVRFDNFYISL